MFVPKWLIAVGLGGWLLLGLQAVWVPKTAVDQKVRELQDKIKELESQNQPPEPPQAEPAPAKTAPTATGR